MVALLGTIGMGSFTVIKIATIIASRYRAAASPLHLKSVDEKLERIEQGMEAMAIEVERISEGQRFTTKLLADRTIRTAPEDRP